MDQHHNSCATPYWYTLYPKEHYVELKKTHLLILVNKHLATDTWAQVDFESLDITAVQVHMELGMILIVNTYSDIARHKGTKQVAQMLREQTCRTKAMGYPHPTV